MTGIVEPATTGRNAACLKCSHDGFGQGDCVLDLVAAPGAPKRAAGFLMAIPSFRYMIAV